MFFFCQNDVGISVNQFHILECVSPALVEPMGHILECVPLGPALTHPACDEPCPEIPIREDCSNLDKATCERSDVDPDECNTVPGSPIICQVPKLDPPVIVPEGLWQGLAGRNTLMEITSGQASMDLNGEMEQTTAGGTIEVKGGPCPDASCSISMAFDLDVGDVSYDTGIFLADDAEFTDIQVVGNTTPNAAVVDASGVANFAGDTVQAAGRGTQSLSVIGLPISTDTEAYLFQNAQSMGMTIDWEAHEFSITGSFQLPAGSDPDEEPEANLGVVASGVIVNEPPSIDAGELDRTLECTSSAGAVVTLDSSNSTDPEDNIVHHLWLQGTSIKGDVLAFTPTTSVTQAVGTSESYFARILDRFIQADSTVVTAHVVDTTPPVIESVVVEPSCIWPPNHKYVRFGLGDELMVEASDICDTSPTVRVVSVTSSQPDNATGNGDGNTIDDVIFAEGGFCVRSERGAAGATGRTYTVTVSATDDFDNETRADVVVTVPHALGSPFDPGCDVLPPSTFIESSDAPATCVFGGPLQASSQKNGDDSSSSAPTSPLVASVSASAPVARPADSSCSASGPRKGAPTSNGWLFLCAMGTVVAALRRRQRWPLVAGAAMLLLGCKSDEDVLTGTVSTLAGNAEKGYADGAGPDARFYLPEDILPDDDKGAYVVDSQNNRLRHVSADGAVSTIAGGSQGFVDGSRDDARFFAPTALARLDDDHFVVVERGNHAVRKVNVAIGSVTTVAGGPNYGYADGQLESAKFHQPFDVVSDGAVVFIADTWNNAIRRIDLAEGVVTTLAGNGEPGTRDGSGGREGTARFNHPFGIALSPDGFLIVADKENGCIRRVDAKTGETTTYSGKCGEKGYEEGGPNARWMSPMSVQVTPGGTVYSCDAGMHVVRAIEIGEGSRLVAGTPSPTFDGRWSDGPASKATIGGCADAFPLRDGRIFVADHHALRVIAP